MSAGAVFLPGPTSMPAPQIKNINLTVAQGLSSLANHYSILDSELHMKDHLAELQAEVASESLPIF